MHGSRRTIVTVAASFAVVLGVGGVAAATNGNDAHSGSPTGPAVAAMHVARTKAAVRSASDETSTTLDPATSTTVDDDTTTTLDDTSTTMAPGTTTTVPTTSTTVDHDKDGDHKLCDDHGKDGDHHDRGRHVGRDTDHHGPRRVGPVTGAKTTRSDDNSGSGSQKSGDSGSHRGRG